MEKKKSLFFCFVILFCQTNTNPFWNLVGLFITEENIL